MTAAAAAGAAAGGTMMKVGWVGFGLADAFHLHARHSLLHAMA